jgi:hypothetical protein
MLFTAEGCQNLHAGVTMKSFLAFLFAISVTGCAGMDSQKFPNNFAQGFTAQSQARMQPTQQIQTPQPTLQPWTPTKYQQTDFQCQQACTNAGYEFGLCKSKCSF